MRTTSLIIALLFTQFAWAQANQYKRPSAPPPAEKSSMSAGEAQKRPTESPSASSDKLDVSDLEQKYWAPKDVDFSVVQNRTYTKTKRPSLSLLSGVLINDSYSEATASLLTANYFFSERMGMELSYLKANPRNSKVTDNLFNDPGNQNRIIPDHNKMQNSLGISYNFVPIYAKVSFLNSSIIYFDLAISPGLALLTYEKQLEDGNQTEKTLALTLDITQYYFLSKWFSLRFDIRNYWYKEKVFEYKDATKQIRTNTSDSTYFLMGATFYF